jgi:hypothetical protein
MSMFLISVICFAYYLLHWYFLHLSSEMKVVGYDITVLHSSFSQFFIVYGRFRIRIHTK